MMISSISLQLFLLFSLGLMLYIRVLHPLARFPGPLIASFTNLWKAYHTWRGDLEKVLLELHNHHGEIIRIGPNHLDFSNASAVKTIHGSGRRYQKSTFYDAFVALRPNIFGTRDEDVHSARRRAVARSFSAQSISKMEVYMDECMVKLTTRLDSAAKTGEVIDLKLWIAFFVIDVLGELAFAQPFGCLDTGLEERMPSLKEHILLSTVLGHIPWTLPYISKITAMFPLSSLRKLVAGRAQLKERAVECVNVRQNTISERPDLLGQLLDELETGHDSSGRAFDIVDVQTEAFGFIVAGSHTTSTSTTLLLWYLINNPETMRNLRNELDSSWSSSNPTATPFSVLAGLKYLQSSITEGFRINPVFVTPLVRVVPTGGEIIAGSFVPGGTDVSVCNHVIHHNEDIFGPDLENFRPERWLDANYDCISSLIPFGYGHRACIGRNIAIAEISKLVAMLAHRYNIEPVERTVLFQDSVKCRPGLAPTVSCGIAELKGKLLVKLERRNKPS